MEQRGSILLSYPEAAEDTTEVEIRSTYALSPLSEYRQRYLYIVKTTKQWQGLCDPSASRQRYSKYVSEVRLAKISHQFRVMKFICLLKQ